MQQKKANKNSPGPGPEPPTTGACRHRVLAAPATPALLSTAPPLPLSQCFALGGISSGGAARHRYPISLSRGTK